MTNMNDSAFSIFPRRLMLCVLKVALFLACIFYLLRKIDLDILLTAFKNANVGWVLFATVLIVLGIVVNGLRVHVLTDFRVGALVGVNSAILSFSANNVLPGRLGEVVKIGYLKMKGLELGDCVRIIFLERLADLNIASTVFLLFFSSLAPQFNTWFIVALILSWAIMLVLLLCPQILNRLIAVIPWHSAREALHKIYNTVFTATPRKLYPALVLTSLLSVGLYFIGCVLIIRFGCGVEISWFDILGAVCLGMLSLAVPSTPAGIGVYEASLVWGLGTMGVAPEQALAAALITHAAQVFPILPWAGAVFFSSQSRLHIAPRA